MATITLRYNPRNTIAKRTLDYILSLGVFVVADEEKTTKSVDIAIKEIKEGKVHHAKSADDMFKKGMPS